MPHDHVPGRVVACVDPHGPAQGHMVGGVTPCLLKLQEESWKMWPSTRACNCSCAIMEIENLQETLQKWRTHLCGNSQAVCVAMWLVEVLRKSFMTQSFLFFFSKCLFHALAIQSSELHTQSMSIHEKRILNLYKMIIYSVFIQTLINAFSIDLDVVVNLHILHWNHRGN